MTPTRTDRASIADMASFSLPLAIGLVATLDVADLIAAGTDDAASIARTCGANEEALYRTLRYVASRDVLEELPDRRFALTPMGHYLRGDVDGTVKHAVRLDGNQMLIFRVMAEAMHTIRTGEPCYERALGVKPFDAFAADPAANERFNAQMRERSRNISAAALRAYDFTGVRTLVDVGGGTGMFLGQVLATHPRMRGVLLELPHVASAAPPLLEELGVAGRCEVVGGDMFEAVPPDADAYLLSSVLHDWSDGPASGILTTCRSAMRPDSRLLIVETIMSDDPIRSRAAKQLDFTMMLASGGRERSVEDFASLLRSAGLELQRVVPTGTSFAVIEAVRSSG